MFSVSVFDGAPGRDLRLRLTIMMGVTIMMVPVTLFIGVMSIGFDIVFYGGMGLCMCV